MVQDIGGIYPLIGGCQADKTVFYVGSPEGLCPFCARPPDYTLAFTGLADAAGAGVGEAAGAPAEPVEPTEIPSQCPDCGAMVRIVITATDVQIVSAVPALPEEPPAGVPEPPAPVEASSSEVDSPGEAVSKPDTSLNPENRPGESTPVPTETPSG